MSSGKCKIKTTMRYDYTTIRLTKIQNTDNTKCCQGRGATETLIHGCWGCKMAQLLWRTFWRFLVKLNIYLPYDPAITLLGIYPKELKTYALQKPAHGCLQHLYSLLPKPGSNQVVL